MTTGVVIIYFLSLMSFAISSRIATYLKALVLQGVLLFSLIMMDIGTLTWVSGFFLVVETLVFKAIMIPYILDYVMRKNNLSRDVSPEVVHFYPAVVSSLIIAAGFLTVYALIPYCTLQQSLYFGVAFSTALTGFFIIFFRKKIITHVIGFIVLENGTFLLSLAYLREMPMFINIGLLMDVFVAVYLFGLFINRISSEFSGPDIDILTSLKD